METKQILANLERADKAYFNTGASVLTDADYDRLREKLERRVKTKQGTPALLIKAQKYLDGTGTMPEGEGKVDLPFYLPSLDKIKSDEDEALTKFIEKACKLAGTYDLEFILSPKLDGSSIALQYDLASGLLVSAATRGNGEVGTDKTPHARVLARLGVIPKKIKFAPSLTKFLKLKVKTVWIRCELMIREDVFNKKWKDKTVNGKKLVESRNACNGFINSKDINREFAKDLEVFAFSIMCKQMQGGMLHKATMLDELAKYGFATYRKLPGYGRINRDAVDSTLLNKQLKLANTGPYKVDGLVFEVNQVDCRHKLLNEGGRPHSGRAWKLSHNASAKEGQDRQTTTVTNQVWKAANDGSYIPTIVYKPVKFGSTKNDRANGIHADNVKALGLGVGAKIVVVRAGGVIPRIVEVVSAGGRPWPKNCACGKPLVHVAPHLYCSDPVNCKYLAFRRLKNAVKYLEIDGLAGARLKQLYDAGFTDILKLRTVNMKKMAKLDGWREKMVKNVHGSIRESVEDLRIADLMVISNAFVQPGFALASTRLKAIVKELGTKVVKQDLSPKLLAKKVAAMPKMGPESAAAFEAGLPAFRKFYSAWRAMDKGT